jgi:hypothetical protein
LSKYAARQKAKKEKIVFHVLDFFDNDRIAHTHAYTHGS